MFTRHASHDVDLNIMIHWLLMNCSAGVMNAVAFIGLGTFATHVTGFGTLFGVHLAESNLINALAALAVPSFFLLGAVISGLLIESRISQKSVPHYDYVMYSGCLLLVVAGIIGYSQGLDEAQSYLHIRKNFVLLSLICLSSGLVNAALSYSSRSTVRITHLTGVTTDLGRGIAELLAARFRGEHASSGELKMNLLRVSTIISFSVGALVGAVSFRRWGFASLFLPAGFFAYAGSHGRKIKLGFLPVDKV